MTIRVSKKVSMIHLVSNIHTYTSVQCVMIGWKVKLRGSSSCHEDEAPFVVPVTQLEKSNFLSVISY